MSIEFNCRQCEKAFRVDDKYAGKKAKCSGCGAVIEVPHPLMPEPTLLNVDILAEILSDHRAEAIVVTCGCGHRLTVPNEQAGKRINCPACMAELLIRDEEGVRTQKTVLLDSDTKASKPGAFRPQFLRYSFYFPFYLIFSVCLLLLAPVLWAFSVSASVCIGVLCAAIVVMFFGWKAIREQCFFGCLNPGVVLETGSFGFIHLAVFTDLTRGEGSYPVIKVLWHRASLQDGRKPDVGMRLSTVAIYQEANGNSPHWLDFAPIAVVALTTDPAIIQMTMSQFSEAEWQELEVGVASLKQPPTNGLHFLRAQ